MQYRFAGHSAVLSTTYVQHTVCPRCSYAFYIYIYFNLDTIQVCIIIHIKYIDKIKIAGWVAGARLAKLKLAVFHRAPRSSAFIRHSSKNINYKKDIQ